MSHIPEFGDPASPAGNVDVIAGDAHLQISGYVTLLKKNFLIITCTRSSTSAVIDVGRKS